MEKRFECLWRNKWITSECTTIEEFIQMYQCNKDMFEDWKAKGVLLDPDSGICDDYANFYTTDAVVAEELGFEVPEWDEEEEWEEEECNEEDELCIDYKEKEDNTEGPTEKQWKEFKEENNGTNEC